MKSKRIVSFILALCMISGLSSCGDKAPDTAAVRIKKAGVLAVQAKDIYDETEYAVAEKIASALNVDAVYTSGAFDISFGIDCNDPDGMMLSDPYRTVRIQKESTEFSPLACYEDHSYCVGIENNELNNDLMEAVNSAISDCLKENVIPSLSVPEGSIGTADRSKAYIYENHANLTPVNYDSPKVLGLSRDMGTEYQDKLIIVCDSPNYWLKLYGLLSGGKKTKQIWSGEEGTQTFPYYKGFKLYDPNDPENKKVLVEMTRTYQPEIIVVALGVNGIAKRNEESFSKIYNQLISDMKEASPDTTFVLASIYPVTSTYKNLSLINNELITAGNSWILKTCETYDCYYLDIFSVLIGDDGFAKPELMQKDGLHPNEEGLTQVLEYIRTHACIQ